MSWSCCDPINNPCVQNYTTQAATVIVTPAYVCLPIGRGIQASLESSCRPFRQVHIVASPDPGLVVQAPEQTSLKQSVHGKQICYQLSPIEPSIFVLSTNKILHCLL